MSKYTDIFAARDDKEREIFEIEDLVIDFQLLIQKAMKEQGVSQKELAQRLGCTPSRVSQYLSTHGANLTLKTVARIVHALGEKIAVEMKSKSMRLPQNFAASRNESWLSDLSFSGRSSEWRNSTPVNDNCNPRKVAA